MADEMDLNLNFWRPLQTCLALVCFSLAELDNPLFARVLKDWVPRLFRPSSQTFRDRVLARRMYFPNLEWYTPREFYFYHTSPLSLFLFQNHMVQRTMYLHSNVYLLHLHHLQLTRHQTVA